jgi:alkaline phosphatase D
MKRILIISSIIVLFLEGCEKFVITRFDYKWKNSPDGIWVGPDFWANRLQDWSVANGKLECRSSKPMRTVHLTTRSIAEKKGNLTSSVNIFLSGGEDSEGKSSAGLLIGAGRGLDYRAASMVFHSWGESAGIYAGLDSRGNLFVRDFEKENYYFSYNKNNNIKWTEARIVLNIVPHSNVYTIKILAVNPFTNIIIDKTEVDGIPADRITGNMALVSDAGYGNTDENGNLYSFSEWSVRGSKLVKNVSHTTGPVLSAQYTLSRNRLKLTAQLMPVCDKDSNELIFQILEDNKWVNFASAKVQRTSYTANISIDGWKRNEDTEFRLVYELRRKGVKTFYLSGIIKHNPSEKEQIRMLSLSGVEQFIRSPGPNWSGIDGGYFPYSSALLFPNANLVENLKKFNPDILYFAGNQVNEESSPTLADVKNTELDYLYKWYLWCITFRDLTSRIPSIIAPYDHNAGHLFQATQASHLPDPFDPAPAENGITSYFTECNIGGVSMAVLEDRKFKSSPEALLPAAEIIDGWPFNRYWNVKYSSRIENAELMGNRQLSFIEKWADDWSDGTWMKVALSQSLFANLATIPRDSLTDKAMPVIEAADSGAYVEGDKLATDFDSDGWPQTGRDKAIRLFRKAFAVHVAGDRQPGSTIQYGVEDYRDAGFAIVSRASVNDRYVHWYPPFEGGNRKPGWPKNYGDFEDGFGNRLTVYAVSNPGKPAINSERRNQSAAGYSAIIFNRSTREIVLTNIPCYADSGKDQPFPFWPVRINQTDNYGRRAAGWLPEVRIEGLKDPVIRVIREYTGELIYTLRINGSSFQPKVFEMGNYRIEIGEPDKNIWKKIEKVYPTEFKEREPVTVRF